MNHISFIMDVRIIIKTIMVVFKKEDVSVDTNVVEGYLWDERQKRAE